jgi:uncharacterized iron-regulated protein
MRSRADDPSVSSPCALFLAAALALAACGGASGKPAEHPREVRGVEAAALPFKVLRARGGQEIGWEVFLAELDRSAAICVGENHRNPHDHWAQLHLVDQLTARNRKAGVATALGMEMFQRPFQGVLDDFAKRQIDEAALLSRSGWKDRWGYDWTLYRPVVLLARERGAALVALNIPREITRKVSRRGLDKLDPVERGKLPEMVLDDAEHRAWWDAIMEGMGAGHGHSGSAGEDEGEDDADDEDPDEGDRKAGKGKGKGQGQGQGKKGKGKASDDKEAEREAKEAGDRIYSAQVLWDESMAEGASRWLAAGAGARRQIVILAGNGHCHESAVVRRIERRGVPAAVSVRPIIDDGEGGVAALLAAPENDYLFVMTPASR